MNDLSEALDQLSSRVDALEKRVHALEQHSAAALKPAEMLLGTVDGHVGPDAEGAITKPVTEPAIAAAAAPGTDLASGEQVSSAFLLLGKAMLGIAGAYLLRALAESSVLPRLLIAVVAIAYAIAWLVAASRTSATARFSGALYAGTSALILAPMLWELTMRFQVLSPTASAAVLGLLVLAATALSWKKERSPDVAVAYGAAALTALALSIVTHVMIPFLALLLAMVAICEYRFIRTGAQGVRILVAMVADCAVWVLIVIYRLPANERADYPALGATAMVAPACLLFLLTVGTVVFRTAVLQRRIGTFETIQSVIAFLLWTLSLLFLLPQFSARLVGVVCLVFASACYAAAYGLFRRAPQLRNFYVFSSWSAALLLAGAWLTLPPAWAIACLALASIASAAIAVRICCTTLECHGIIYLTVAAFACGLLEYSFHALAGAMPATVAWTVFLVSACALLCYIAAREHEGEAWQLQVLHLVPALLVVCAVAALLAHGSLVLVALRITPGVFHVAFIRTLILCAIALGLAFAGSRWHRPEMRRIAYAALAFVAAKLVFEDLRHGHMGFIAGSIFVFALTLIGVPRLAKAGQRT